MSASAKYFQRSEISSADVDVEPAYDGAMIELMTAPTPTSTDLGRIALEAGNWQVAKAVFEEALASSDAPDILDGLGQAHFWLNEFPQAIALRERAYVGYRAAGDRLSAAELAMWLAVRQATLYANAAAMNGWLARAERLLVGAKPSPQHARMAIIRASLTPDPLEMERHAGEAMALAERLADDGLEILALSYLGLAKVVTGRIDEGMTELDEAMAAVAGKEVANFGVIGEIYCNLLSACDQAADYRRAEEWCRIVDDFARRQNFTPLFTICRTFYGGLLTAIGRWAEAEHELVTACRMAEDGVRGQRVTGLVRLADLRVRQGRLEEAEQLLIGCEESWEALPALAALRLAKGEGEVAVALLERRLWQLHPGNMMSASLLAMLVEAQVLLSNLGAAGDAVAKLRELARASCSIGVQAMSEHSAGRVAVAAGDPLASERLEAAVRLFSEVEMPLEGARARLDLAQALSLDRPAVAAVEARSAFATFERLSADLDADRAAGLLRKLGVRGRTGPKRGGGLTKREAEVLRLLEAGASNQQIAARLFVSQRTAEHHVATLLSKLGLRSRGEATAYAVRKQGPDPARI